MDRLYESCVQKFNGLENVMILKKNSLEGLNYLKTFLRDEKLNYIYLDASHQYETVLDDLIECESLLGPDGLIQMNDCCHSTLGIKQNLGVLEASINFCKRTNFIPVLISNTDWTDVLFFRKGSVIFKTIDKILNMSNVTYVEVPHQLFGAMNVRNGVKANISFC